MQLRKVFKNNKGIGLVETILAMAIAIIVITALVSLAIFTLRSSQQSKYLLEGSKLANQELELVRAYKESVDWATFLAGAQACDGVADRCYIFVDDSGPIALSIVNTGAEDLGVPAVSLERYFRATKQDGTALDGTENLVRISVTVSWQIGNNPKFAHTYTDISNWQGN